MAAARPPTCPLVLEQKVPLSQPSTSQRSPPPPPTPPSPPPQLGAARGDRETGPYLSLVPPSPPGLSHSKEGKGCTPLQPPPTTSEKVRASESGGDAGGERGGGCGQQGAGPVPRGPSGPRGLALHRHLTGRVCVCVCLSACLDISLAQDALVQFCVGGHPRYTFSPPDPGLTDTMTPRGGRPGFLLP